MSEYTVFDQILDLLEDIKTGVNKINERFENERNLKKGEIAGLFNSAIKDLTGEPGKFTASDISDEFLDKSVRQIFEEKLTK